MAATDGDDPHCSSRPPTRFAVPTATLYVAAISF
jgi:hypothetical protein